MPRLTATELDSWIQEFNTREGSNGESPRTVDTSWSDTMVDTALVVTRLAISGTSAFLRRTIGGSPEWTITFEARDADAEMTATQALALAAEVGRAGRLCAYLTERTARALRRPEL